METIACLSGYFDPIRVGHIEYFKLAKQHADKLMVIVKNDKQSAFKKGTFLMSCEERMKIIKELKCVDFVVKSIDIDRTVCKTLSEVTPRPTYFCNGGDQHNNTIPETAVCKKLNIQLLDGLGEKIQSSSWLLKGTRPNETLELESSMETC